MSSYRMDRNSNMLSLIYFESILHNDTQITLDNKYINNTIYEPENSKYLFKKHEPCIQNGFYGWKTN